MGKLVEVEIISSGKHYMIGQLVDETKMRRPVDVPPPLPKGQVSGAIFEVRVIWLVLCSIWACNVIDRQRKSFLFFFVWDVKVNAHVRLLCFSGV